MTNAQRQNLADCQKAECRFLHRCEVQWGRRCTYLGGKKVPRLRIRPHALEAATAMAYDVRTLKTAWD